MREIVGVRFERAGRVYYFDAAGLEIQVNDYVVAEGDGEERIGRVVISPRQLIIDQLGSPVLSILRKATPKDLEGVTSGWVKP